MVSTRRRHFTGSGQQEKEQGNQGKQGLLREQRLKVFAGSRAVIAWLVMCVERGGGQSRESLPHPRPGTPVLQCGQEPVTAALGQGSEML